MAALPCQIRRLEQQVLYLICNEAKLIKKQTKAAIKVTSQTTTPTDPSARLRKGIRGIEAILQFFHAHRPAGTNLPVLPRSTAAATCCELCAVSVSDSGSGSDPGLGAAAAEAAALAHLCACSTLHRSHCRCLSSSACCADACSAPESLAIISRVASRRASSR